MYKMSAVSIIDVLEERFPVQAEWLQDIVATLDA